MVCSFFPLSLLQQEIFVFTSRVPVFVLGIFWRENCQRMVELEKWVLSKCGIIRFFTHDEAETRICKTAIFWRKIVALKIQIEERFSTVIAKRLILHIFTFASFEGVFFCYVLLLPRIHFAYQQPIVSCLIWFGTFVRRKDKHSRYPSNKSTMVHSRYDGFICLLFRSNPNGRDRIRYHQQLSQPGRAAEPFDHVSLLFPSTKLPLLYLGEIGK